MPSKELAGRALASALRRPWALWCSILVVIAVPLLAQAWPVSISRAAITHRWLYVPADSDRVRVYDIDAGHKLIATIKIGGTVNGYWNPRGIQASIPNKTVFVSYWHTPGLPPNDGVVVAIDIPTNTVKWIKKYPGADAMDITPDGKKLYVSSGEAASSDYFYVVDTATGAQLGTVPVFTHTHNGIVSPAGDRAYLASVLTNYVTVADTATDKPIGKLGPFGDAVRPLTINGRGTLVYVNVNHLHGFEIADVATGKVIQRVEIDKKYPSTNGAEDPSHGIGLTADERELWVAGARDYVHIFDNTVMPPQQIGAVKVTGIPKWIGMSIDNRYIYPGTGEVIDRLARKVIPNLTIEKSKRHLEVDLVDDLPVRASDYYSKGYVDVPVVAAPTPTPSPTASPSATPRDTAVPSATLDPDNSPGATVTPTPSATSNAPSAPETRSVWLALVLHG